MFGEGGGTGMPGDLDRAAEGQDIDPRILRRDATGKVDCLVAEVDCALHLASVDLGHTEPDPVMNQLPWVLAGVELVDGPPQVPDGGGGVANAQQGLAGVVLDGRTRTPVHVVRILAGFGLIDLGERLGDLGPHGSAVADLSMGDGQRAGEHRLLGRREGVPGARAGRAQHGDRVGRVAVAHRLLRHATQDVGTDGPVTGLVGGAQRHQPELLGDLVTAAVERGPARQPGEFRGDGVEPRALVLAVCTGAQQPDDHPQLGHREPVHILPAQNVVHPPQGVDAVGESGDQGVVDVPAVEYRDGPGGSRDEPGVDDRAERRAGEGQDGGPLDPAGHLFQRGTEPVGRPQARQRPRRGVGGQCGSVVNETAADGGGCRATAGTAGPELSTRS